jgi:hypothetical protein
MSVINPIFSLPCVIWMWFPGFVHAYWPQHWFSCEHWCCCKIICILRCRTAIQSLKQFMLNLSMINHSISATDNWLENVPREP